MTRCCYVPRSLLTLQRGIDGVDGQSADCGGRVDRVVIGVEVCKQKLALVLDAVTPNLFNVTLQTQFFMRMKLNITETFTHKSPQYESLALAHQSF